MRRAPVRVKPYIVELAPLPLGAGEQVVDGEPLVPAGPQRRQVEPRPALPNVVGIGRADDQDRVGWFVVCRFDPLAECRDRVVVDLVETKVAEPVQGAMLPADLVQPGEERSEGSAVGLGPGVVPRSQLVFLTIQVLFAAWAHRKVLEQLIARIHAPGRGEHRRQYRANAKCSGTARLEKAI